MTATIFVWLSGIYLGYEIGRSDRIARARKRLFLKTVAQMSAVNRRRRHEYIAAHADEFKEMP